jgi:uncharacterized membrane protein YdbT with pleckstrin-like domain
VATPGGGPVAAAGAEQVLWVGAPSMRALALDAAGAALLAGVVLAGVLIAYEPALRALAGVSRDVAAFVADNRSGFDLAAWLFVATVVGVRLVRLASRAIALRGHRYRVTNQRLVVETGVLSRTINELDMRTIDDVALSQTAVQRLLGVGEVAVVSSEPGPRQPRARVRLQGVRDPRAVRELLRNAAYQATRGQVFTRST